MKIKTLPTVKCPDTLRNGELSSERVSREFISGSDYTSIQYFYWQSWKHSITEYLYMINYEWEEYVQ